MVHGTHHAHTTSTTALTTKGRIGRSVVRGCHVRTLLVASAGWGRVKPYYGVPYLKIVVETPPAIVVVPWPKSRLAMLPGSI